MTEDSNGIRMNGDSDATFPCLGDIPNPDGYAYLRGDCGDSLEVFLSVRDRRILRARFEALACQVTMACGNAAMELAENKTLAEAFRIHARDVSDHLGGLGSNHFHCAELAVETLRKALEDCIRIGDASWKKLYRNRTLGPG